MFEERLSEFVTLLIVINPLGTLPVFLAMTGGLDAATQRRIAVTAVLVSFAVLLFFIAAGGFLLEKLGISLRAFQIAGGIVLFLVALDMVRGSGHAQPLTRRRNSRPRSQSIRSPSRRLPARPPCSPPCC